MSGEGIRANEEATHRFVAWCLQIRARSTDDVATARTIARWLGAHPLRGKLGDGDRSAVFGFWTPELVEGGVAPEHVTLELLLPEEEIDLTVVERTARFTVHRVATERAGEYTWAVVDGLTPGTTERLGPFYRLSYRTTDGHRRSILDPLAYSVPFGATAPAELYDVEGMLANRSDRPHFTSAATRSDPDGTPRFVGPSNMLEIHTPTATEAGTLTALAARYRRIADRVRAGEPLTPTEKSFVGYDAVQLMPVEPTIVYEAGPAFWEEHGDAAPHAAPAGTVGEPGGVGTAEVTLRRPDTTNWGYDVMTVASPAVNPTLLSSGRPRELLELIEVLHDFPGGPIGVVLDVVYGHADNQTLSLLNHRFFAGANMYGQNLNYREPVVRAILLEMQRRKSNYGVDGVRVDGAQDFTYWVAEEQALYHDDDYLALMNDVEQDVAGVRYRPWMVFEDGRPWPRDDWELASSYREVTKKLPNVVQWGPLTFAHNTPFLFTFWISKWWRIEEVLRVGSHWITGNSNHDTLRRGTQVEPGALINTYLGDSPAEILANAYDNPASRIFDVFVPGIPMDFVHANMRAPWSFIRNTDDRYGVKVVSEEAYFLDWAVTPATFARPDSFARLKARGFDELAELKRFMSALDAAVSATNYRLDAVAAVLEAHIPRLSGPHPFTPPTLKAIARDWMDDVHDYCTVTRYEERLNADHDDHAERNYAVRRFRLKRPWLASDLGPADRFARRTPVDGSVVFFGLRHAPDGGERLVFVGNMEGAPTRLTPGELPLEDLDATGGRWRRALATAGLEGAQMDAEIELANGSAVVFAERGR